MSEFKSAPSRLARLFRASRDKWKEKAIEKQRKLRALEVKVRDLSGSREYWKNRAMAAEKGLPKEDGENFTERKDELELIKSEQEDEEELIYTHDVTHAMALLLKYELNSDQRYQSFTQKCHYCRQQLQQTELDFLSPPAQRSQCRYFNVERLTEWGLRLLEVLKDPLNIWSKLVNNSDPIMLNQRIIDKLEWLVDYQTELIRWHQMTVLTRRLETQLKKSGINQQSLDNFQENKWEFGDSKLSKFYQHICDYVTTQSTHIEEGKTFLATSDVIESLFGKYKRFSARCPFKEMGQMLLTIGLSTMELTNNVVKNALEEVSFTEVQTWLAKVFGQSILSKRKTLFLELDVDTETV